jgi:POT family proton-dependent oligopeptide transporter
MVDPALTPALSRPPERTLLGHPLGLYILSGTELWERFSYYGMRALLILFMTDAARGGMAMPVEQASAVYGLYTFGVYFLALPGGWIADRLVGQRKAVLYGGVLIALGHYSLAVPSTATFYTGLLLIVLGTGLLKPNISAIVGDFYSDKGGRRDAAFSIFYMGINVGAFFGPLVCSYLGEKIDWHYGFGAAGVGMTLAIAVYAAGYKNLLGAGELRPDVGGPAMLADAKRKLVAGLACAAVGTLSLVLLSRAGWVSLTGFARATGLVVVLVALVYFSWVIAAVCRDRVERHRVIVCALLFVGAALFWSGFEQAGSSMNLFAENHTERVIGGWTMPTGWLQSVNAIFIILLAPVVGLVWLRLGARNPSIPVKFGLGLVLLGVGFFVLAWGSTYVEAGKVGMRWLVATYFLHTVGELCLSPVGLSSVTKLAPERLVGQMMGTWFMGSALGNLVAGLAAGYIESMPLPRLFLNVALFVIAGGAMFLLFSKPIRRLCHGVN